MNWGYRVTLFFVAFVAFMLMMFYKCVQQDFDLVAEDYYAKELGYQEMINQQNNANELAQKPTFVLEADVIKLQFSEKVTIGKINVFRPSDDELDFEEPLALNDSFAQDIPLNKFKKGVYKLRLNWEQGPTKYYTEETIHIP